MMGKQRILVMIAMQAYLRNWVQAGAFDELSKKYDVHFVVAKYDWDHAEIENYGIKQYQVISQGGYRKFLLRRLLTVTMFKHARISRAFRIKLLLVKPRMRLVYQFLSLPMLYEILLWAYGRLLPKWTEFSDVAKEIKPSLVMAPSLAADSFTIDMTYSAKKLGIKSLLLINSWDNLVSKGVLPIPPDCLVVWGQQGINQAINLQKMPAEKVVPLGVPRFESYYERSQRKSTGHIHAFNKIHEDKKIILYAATSIPFDDVQALAILDRAISSASLEYVILFRPHPEMMKRVGEVSVEECGFRNVYMDQQLAGYYASRFKSKAEDYPSYLNNAELSYYPELMKSISGMICPPTTLSLEGAINGVPCLMICYGDGRNTWLSPDLVCQYENVEEILRFPGIVPCYGEADLLECFRKLVAYSEDDDVRNKLVDATRYVVYRDDKPYGKRLCNLVDKLLVPGNP